ncbi:DNA-directed RNA polymerase subunit alpha [Tumidithrix helvetica PCC 7403]|uniref:DNA-directed RNA polymerase subunit alpha n=1 Tax=Tumidithrix elongata BACA0141 TaxID=2716417 RepID=A0AAW9Q1D8_9CYAN|nr:DNA-directed RNA polymerase subunit alpha [Tumidithrix elongata RA019]
MAQFQVECIESYTDKTNSQYSRFVLEPLERGQGITVGNALRRVLLSNLEGAAVTVVRIAGVNHEFATIPGVREDVLDLLLNLKELVLKSYSSAPQIVRLMARGPATVTAGDFHPLPSDIEVVNPDQYVATLCEGATLEMELTIEKGKGYRSVDRSKEDHNSPIDSLKIDAVFMPVNKVKYDVRDARIGEGVDKESLSIEIWTNGSITPQEALSQAASVLVGLFSPLQEITLVPSRPEPSDDQDETKQIHIEELQLSVRAYNCLKRAQINTVADLLEYTQDDLLEIKNFGQKSAEEVIEALKRHLGLTLPESKTPKPV